MPGFTTAWFSNKRALAIDPMWPQEIFDQIDKLGREWIETWLASIGPMFEPDDSRLKIAKNFLTGINAWIRSRQLSHTRFVDAAIKEVGRVTERQPPDNASDSLRIPVAPGTDSERLLARALELSLKISAPTPR